MIKHNQYKSRELKLFYGSVWLMNLAEGMIAIFVPVYLFKLGYPLPQIFLFYLLVSLFFVIAAAPGARIVSAL